MSAIRAYITLLSLLLCCNAYSTFDDSLFRAAFGIESIYSTSVYTDTPTCVIPFTRAGNLILIKAHADDQEGNFILDTGAPGLILNVTYFRDYPLQHIQDAEQTSVSGYTQQVMRTKVKKFRFGTYNYYNTEADVVPLGHLENTRGVRILGLLGLSLFKGMEMIIDYQRSLIYLHLINRKEASVYKHAMLKQAANLVEVPIEMMDNKIVTRLELSGKKLKFIIDCGAETNLIDSRLPNKLFENITISGRVIIAGTGNRRVEALSGNVKNMKIANVALAQFPVIVTNLEKTCFSYNGCIDGILGFDFLALHKVGFNFVNNKMYLWK